MDEQQFSFKDLYDVSLKSAYPIEIGNRKIEAGEIIAFFDKIQLSNWNEIKSRTAARGGFDNRARVWWESTKEVQLVLSQGIFSKEQFAILCDARAVYKDENPLLFLNQRERLESNENCEVGLKYVPTGKVFVYDVDSGSKLENVEILEDKKIKIKKPYQDVIVDYEYNYLGSTTQVKLGQRLIEGWLSLQGKTKVQDDVTGLIKTGIIQIPKLKLMSGLSMQLGERATPMVGKLQAVAVPDGVRGNSTVMELIFLDEDIDSDM